MMIGTAVLLSFLLLQVNGITADAKCLAGYEWMFSSTGQSPCDVAAELAAVCVGGQFNLEPLDTGYVYAGPTQANQNSCRCSSVYYSLLSACGFCQGRNYVRWSIYNANCPTVYVPVYNQQIPVGVKVPAYAYQNISDSDTFNVTLAESEHGTESSRPPSTNTSSSAATSTSGGTSKNTPTIVGGVVGGITGLVIIVLISCFLLRKRKPKLRSQADTLTVQLNSNTGYMPNIPPSFAPMLPPGSPGSSEGPNDLSKYSPSMNSPYREHSPPYRFQTMTPNDTGVSTQNSVIPQTMPVFRELWRGKIGPETDSGKHSCQVSYDRNHPSELEWNCYHFVNIVFETSSPFTHPTIYVNSSAICFGLAT